MGVLLSALSIFSLQADCDGGHCEKEPIAKQLIAKSKLKDYGYFYRTSIATLQECDPVVWERWIESEDVFLSSNNSDIVLKDKGTYFVSYIVNADLLQETNGAIRFGLATKNCHWDWRTVPGSTYGENFSYYDTNEHICGQALVHIEHDSTHLRLVNYSCEEVHLLSPERCESGCLDDNTVSASIILIKLDKVREEEHCGCD